MKDDFETRSKYVASSELEFVNSWKESPLCGDVGFALDPCSHNTFRRAWAERKCGIINSQTFAACHSQVGSRHRHLGSCHGQVGCTAVGPWPPAMRTAPGPRTVGRAGALRAASHRCTACLTTRPVCATRAGATPVGTASACVTLWLPTPRPAWTRASVWTGGPPTFAVSALLLSTGGRGATWAALAAVLLPGRAVGCVLQGDPAEGPLQAHPRAPWHTAEGLCGGLRAT